MFIEIHGAGFQNKGAELMLCTVVSELKQRLPDFVPVIDPTYGPYSSRCKLELHQIFPLRTHVGTPGFSKRFRRQKLFASLGGERLLQHIGGGPLSAYGCISLSRLQGLIDLAGFAYTDLWGSQPSKDFADLTDYYKSRKKPVILMPQALGPFQRKETRSAFKKVLMNATLVFPRDQQSYEYALELSSEPEKIMKAPDITLFYPNADFEVHSGQERNYVCIIPSTRILEQGRQTWGDKYQLYLLQIVKELIKYNFRVHVMVNDVSGDDLKLAQHLCGEVNSPAVTLIQEEDPVKLKQLVAGSLIVVGSRYHSLVAAFSKAVPSLAMGWSHKYDMLYRDFGCEKFVISPDIPIGVVIQYLNELIDHDNNGLYRQQIIKRLQEMYITNQKMWTLVTDVLTASSVQT